ncbi:hypothetical protein ACHAXS_006923 [Conticribra weissflogii]
MTTMTIHHPSTTNERDNHRRDWQNSKRGRDDLSIAKEIPGVELHIPPPHPNEPNIQIVYPDHHRATLSTRASSSSSLSSKPKHKGWVLLLHACTHSALKFFSPSPRCPKCVGLSEELLIVRWVMDAGYIPIAISCADETRSDGDGDERLERVVFSIGASSGGTMAAELVAKQLSQAAIVMVMSLSDPLVEGLRRIPRPIYLAPMPRDEGTLRRVQRNFEALRGHDDGNGGDKGPEKSHIVLDTQSCDSLPLTPDYLVQRVPRMTREAAATLTSKLKDAGHIDHRSNRLIVDPTKSNWRNVISPRNGTHWLDRFALTPGYSPLAKALHRAWAFHEYCSEVVVPAIHFFEDWYDTSKRVSMG